MVILFPHLASFKQTADSPNNIHYKISEKVYDGAFGSAGFLCEADAHMRSDKDISAADFETLQRNILDGKENSRWHTLLAP